MQTTNLNRQGGGSGAASMRSLHELLNSVWHKPAMIAYLAIVLAHWAEHLLQAFQVFALGWPRPQAGGGLGLVFPWLVQSEAMHYAYAIVMLIGLVVLRSAFDGPGRMWWDIALGIQFWHHFEHALLLGQVVVGQNIFGMPVPTSIVQLVMPRVELHLFYNAIVFVPMLVAMYYHRYVPATHSARCNCAVRPASSAAVAG